jgi:hypothetical protein
MANEVAQMSDMTGDFISLRFGREDTAGNQDILDFLNMKAV